jgi:hypothetical protein
VDENHPTYGLIYARISPLKIRIWILGGWEFYDSEGVGKRKNMKEI